MRLLDGVKGDATLSPDGRYRYLLRRVWDYSRPAATWVMLNPSTADADTDDQTLRRVQAYSRTWGCGRVLVVNLFALRATRPAELLAVVDPVGPVNDEVLGAVLGSASTGAPVVAAWGAWGARFPDRVREVLNLAVRERATLQRLGPPLKGGHPRHPCRLPDGLCLEEHW